MLRSDISNIRRGRFEAKYWKGKGDICWIWLGAKLRGKWAYGSFKVKNTEMAHRVAYLLEHGDFDQNLLVCHKCDNPSCVNPNHLFLGTDLDNARDMVRKGRSLHRKNEDNPFVKISNADVQELRLLYRSGSWTQMQLAHRYSISQPHVSDIVLYLVRDI